jgi:hypothetical protein
MTREKKVIDVIQHDIIQYVVSFVSCGRYEWNKLWGRVCNNLKQIRYPLGWWVYTKSIVFIYRKGFPWCVNKNPKLDKNIEQNPEDTEMSLQLFTEKLSFAVINIKIVPPPVLNFDLSQGSLELEGVFRWISRENCSNLGSYFEYGKFSFHCLAFI